MGKYRKFLFHAVYNLFRGTVILEVYSHIEKQAGLVIRFPVRAFRSA